MSLFFGVEEKYCCSLFPPLFDSSLFSSCVLFFFLMSMRPCPLKSKYDVMSPTFRVNGPDLDQKRFNGWRGVDSYPMVKIRTAGSKIIQLSWIIYIIKKESWIVHWGFCQQLQSRKMVQSQKVHTGLPVSLVKEYRAVLFSQPEYPTTSAIAQAIIYVRRIPLHTIPYTHKL